MNRVRILLIAAITAFSLSATAEASHPKSSKKQTPKTSTTKKRTAAKSSDYPTTIEPPTDAYPENAYDMPQNSNGYYGNSTDIITGRTVTKEIPIEAPAPPPPPRPVPVDSDKVFDSVEVDPVFPGGQVALMKYVAEHIKYPAIAQENGIQGRVTVQFVVTKTGSIGQVRVVRGKDPELDKEAVRVVKTLPKFTPGKMNGHAVNVWYTLPITFRLQKDVEPSPTEVNTNN